ncbi:MAG: thioredoxin family protein [Bacteroidia bacterium]
MIRRFLSFLILLLPLVLAAQVFNPVTWDVSTRASGEGECEVVFKATIEGDWHLYSQFVAEGGPVPTSINLEGADGAEFPGPAKELGDLHKGFDKTFDMDVSYFEKKVTFIQKVKLSKSPARVKGYLNFMVCNDERCLPPTDVEFDFTVESESSAPAKDGQGKTEEPAPAETKVDEGKKTVAETKPEPVKEELPKVGTSTIEEAKDKVASIAEEAKEEAAALVEEALDNQDEADGEGDAEGDAAGDAAAEKNATQSVDPNSVQAVSGAASLFSLLGEENPLGNTNLDKPAAECGNQEAKKQKGFLLNLLLGFLGGLAALLTPCVFPMIPLTVSFFTKSSQDRASGLKNAFLYSGAIVGIYFLLSLPIHLVNNKNILNDMATSMPLNLVFFAVFVFFAFSFFGYYELTLPSGFVNKISSKSSLGGFPGIFFMALTLALVSFSCTGPILGALLGSTLSGASSTWDVTGGFLGFGLGLGLPFGLFAAFPGMLNSLPQSGGWMNSVKVILGFVELALALKFFSTVDLTQNWDILRYELFLGLWIVIAFLTAMYLFGFIRFPHDGPKSKLPTWRWVTGILFLLMGAYMAMGFAKDDRTGMYVTPPVLSGIIPPATINYFNPGKPVDPAIKARFPSFTKCANNLDCFKDLQEGMTYAKETNKPVFVDFTGHACQNCRKMEDQVWNKPSVYDHLYKDYVLVSLYVDDRKKLDSPIKVMVPNKDGGAEETLRTVGRKWATLQTVAFANNSQPYYVLLNSDGYLLSNPVGYTPDHKEYRDYLQCGLEQSKKLRAQAGK